MEGLYMRLSAKNNFTSDLAENRKFKLKLLRIIGFFLMIIVGYLFLKGNHYSKLAGYFVYMSAACSILPLPSPPYVIGIGKIFNPWLIAFLGAFGNIIAAFFEYYFIGWLFSQTELQQKVEANKFFQRFANSSFCAKINLNAGFLERTKSVWAAVTCNQGIYFFTQQVA